MKPISVSAKCIAAILLIGMLMVRAETARASDQALVVGVNLYPGLQSGSNLEGCVNDAKLMKATLEKYRFQVKLLTNGDATKQGILSTLKNLKGQIGNGDRVVFYFAGHGTTGSNGRAVILPSDARDKLEAEDIANDIPVDELYRAIKELPATSKTVILDSCHSGGMMRSIKRVSGLKSRLYVRTRVQKRLTRDGKKWISTEANKQDSQDDIVPDNADNKPSGAGGGICYYTACKGDEFSAEKVIQGVRDGVFTYNLTKRLTGKGELWQDVSAAVNGLVASETDDLQHPNLTAAWLTKPAFDYNPGSEGDSGSGGDKPEPHTMADLYNTDNPNASMIVLERDPRKNPIAVGQNAQFNVQVGQDGYLVILGRDPNNELYVLFPAKGGADAAKMQAGPHKIGKFKPDTAGTDRVKAFLFTTREGADRMLSAMTDAGGSNRSAKRDQVMKKFSERKWRSSADKDRADFYTSELISEIVPQGEAN